MINKELYRLQQNFQDYLLNQNTDIINDVVSDELNSAKERLTIYKEAYVFRLLEMLYHDYPVLARYAGDDLFNRLGNQYITAHPSHYRSIRWFSQDFPAFIHTESSDYHFLSELALFELALATAFDAENSSTLTEMQLQSIPAEKWATITFSLHASVQLLLLNWNVVSVWKAMSRVAIRKPKKKKYQRTQTCLIWRNGLETYFTNLKSSEAYVLQGVKEGKPFGEICENLGRWVSRKELILHVASLLKSWIHNGLITAVNIN